MQRESYFHRSKLSSVGTTYKLANASQTAANHGRISGTEAFQGGSWLNGSRANTSTILYDNHCKRPRNETLIDYLGFRTSAGSVVSKIADAHGLLPDQLPTIVHMYGIAICRCPSLHTTCFLQCQLVALDCGVTGGGWLELPVCSSSTPL